MNDIAYGMPSGAGGTSVPDQGGQQGTGESVGVSIELKWFSISEGEVPGVSPFCLIAILGIKYTYVTGETLYKQ